MEVQQIVAELEQEISRLKQARALLAGESTGKRKRGRPAKSAANPAPHNTGLTPAGRRRISEALKRRWAAHRKARAKAAKSENSAESH